MLGCYFRGPIHGTANRRLLGPVQSPPRILTRQRADAPTRSRENPRRSHRKSGTLVAPERRLGPDESRLPSRATSQISDPHGPRDRPDLQVVGGLRHPSPDEDPRPAEEPGVASHAHRHDDVPARAPSHARRGSGARGARGPPTPPK
jgi:hypothetical protein